VHVSSPFADACREAFGRLCERYAFADPEVESIGREQFVRYHRGNQTVSIAYEAGSVPIVELFYPPEETAERPVDWAKRNNVDRTRRIPRLRTGVPFSDSRGNFAEYLRACASALEEVERQWLAAHHG
jgi:hypothetical protein